jgi:hypothetical protein
VHPTISDENPPVTRQIPLPFQNLAIGTPNNPLTIKITFTQRVRGYWSLSFGFVFGGKTLYLILRLSTVGSREKVTLERRSRWAVAPTKVVEVRLGDSALPFSLARMVAWEPGPGPEGRLQKFLGKAKKGFRFALKPVTIWRLASFDRPVFAGATLDQNH